MAIRFKYDTAAVVIPEDKAQQRFGQQLVQQQQKYANDQRQDIQSRMYDQQRIGMQQAFMQERDKAQGQQALERMNQAQKFGLQQNDAAQAAQMQQRDLGVFDAQVKAVTAMAQDAMKNPNVPLDVKRKMQALIVGKGAVNGAGWDAKARQEYLNGYLNDMNGHLDGIKPEDPAHVQANKGLLYRQPDGPYMSPEELAELKRTNPNAEIQTWQDGKMMPPATPLPAPNQTQVSAQDYYKDPKNEKLYDQKMNAAKSVLQDQIDAGKKDPMSDEELNDEAWKQVERDHNFKQKNTGSGSQSTRGIQSQANNTASPPKEENGGFVSPDGMKWTKHPTGGYVSDKPTSDGYRVTLPDGRIKERLGNGWIDVQSSPTQTNQPATSLLEQAAKDISSAIVAAGPNAIPTVQPEQPAASSQPQQSLPSTTPPAPAQPAQASQKPWVPWSDRIVGEEYVDLDGSILVKTPTGVISKGKVPPGTPLPVEAGVAPPDQFTSQAARDVAAADAVVSDSVPPTPNTHVEDTLFPQEAPAITTQSTQNPWMELAAPEQQKTAATQMPAVVAPDFGKLAASATDDSDRAVFGKLHGMYDKQSSEIQNAISILVDPSKQKKERAAAALYLKNAGIDLEKLAGPNVDEATKRLNQYQSNSTTTMR